MNTFLKICLSVFILSATISTVTAQNKTSSHRKEKYGGPLPAGTVVRLGKRMPPSSKLGIFRVKFLAGGKKIVTARFYPPNENYSLVELWRFPSGRLLRSTKIRGQVFGMSSGGRFMIRPVYSTKDWSYHEYISLWDMHDKKRLWKIKTAKSSNYADISPAGDLAVSANWDSSASLHDIKTGQTRQSFKVKFWAVPLAAFSGDGRHICFSDMRGNFSLWNTKTGRKEREIAVNKNDAQNPHWQVFQIALSHDGTILAERYNGGITYWDMASGSRIGGVAHDQTGWAMALSADGRLLASKHPTSGVSLWEVATGKLLGRLNAKEEYLRWVECLAFDKSGRYLVSGGANQSALVWDLAKTPALLKPMEDYGIEAESDLLWRHLKQSKPARAYRAVAALVHKGDAAVKLLGQILKPRKTKTRYLHQLDTGSKFEKLTAYYQLRDLGSGIWSTLLDARQRVQSVRVRENLDALLKELRYRRLTPDELCQIRAVTTLQWIGTPASVRLLQRLATGDRWAAQTRAARLALALLKKR